MDGRVPTRLLCGCIVTGLFAVAPLPRCEATSPEKPVTSNKGMVVSVSEPASRAGAAMLRRGGNAVDAAVTTAFSLAVTYPPAGNIGGGGFMMVLPKPGMQPVCVEYRETAPAAATPTMFSLTDSRLSPKMVGVPGTVRGLELAHATFGKLSWSTLLQPAIRLADQGFSVDASLARSLNKVLKDDKSLPFKEMRRVYAPPSGKAWQAGDRLVQPDLAGTLRRIAQQGADGFYRGPVAARIVREMQEGNGLISNADLDTYHANLRTPIHGTFHRYDVYGPPPPSSGGIVLIEMLNMVERFGLRKKGRWSPETIHLMIESMRRAYLDRARYLGDQDFVAIPKRLTTKDYAASLASKIDTQKATRSLVLAPEIPIADEGTSTTHFSVIDKQGMAVANTFTLEQSYGARVMVRGAGFLLNNEMGDFNWRPGHTDKKGRIGTEPNTIAPRKRMLSSQTPVLVLKDGKPCLITGSPGGRTIINTVFCVVLNVLEFNMPLPEAIAAPRLHHQWLPDQVRFAGFKLDRYQDLVQQLRSMGHRFNPKAGRQGDAHSIYVDAKTGIRTGVADTRISGKAVAAD